MRKECAELGRPSETLKAASAYFTWELDPTRPTTMSFIDEDRPRFGVEPICRSLDWCVGSYYARKNSPPAPCQQGDHALVPAIRPVYADNYVAYGARRVWK